MGKRKFFLTAALLVALSLTVSGQSAGRERISIDGDWRFAYGHSYDVKKDFNHATGYFSYFTKAGYGDGPAAKTFDDRAWRVLNLPHDWAVELPFHPDAGYSHGYKTIGRNFPETSVGWYRKTIYISQADLGKRISVEFDGVHRNSTVWVNGFYLGEEHSGYAGFAYDITDYLQYAGENVIAVRVDASMEEGWYYEGAGIYRHVWLSKTSPLHIARYGTFISSSVAENSADVTARITVINEGARTENFYVARSIVNAKGETVARGELTPLTLKPGETGESSSVLRLDYPSLWSVETPYLYTLVTTLSSNGTIVDRYDTPFGIRTVQFDAREGFLLNGKRVNLKGTNNHQDHAGVGTAIPDVLQEYRIKRLKEMGCNAYRCSHNPPTPELLDACDRLGMLVIDENRLLGTTPEHLDMLGRMILRDRNHPSVIIWSIGNEEWAIEGNVTGARIAATMQSFTQRLDPTRRVTYASSGWGNGISTVQDVMGFNYIFNGDIDKQSIAYPDQPRIGTEETTSRSTRGVYVDDTANAHMMAADRKLAGRSIEEGFKFYAARPFLSGLFFWTGFDHRGEPNPFGWPQVASQCGILDLCGFPKDMFYYLKSWWTDEPVLHIFPHWNWRGKEGQPIGVWAYSNCEEVELFLNDKSLGRKYMPKNSHCEWMVPYEPGLMIARGYKGGREIVIDRIETTTEPTFIRLATDRTSILADNKDVCIITVQVNDERGRPVPTADNEISFSIHGPGRIIGVGNGDPSSHDPDRYIETVYQVPIENLKTQVVETVEQYPETGFDFDDAAWLPAINGQGEYDVRMRGGMKTAVIRGTFTLPDFSSMTEIALWPKSLGEEQAVYVNGQLIAKNIKRDDAVQRYRLDRTILRKGKNVYAIVGIPLAKRFQYDNLNTDPGTIQVYNPPPVWKRRVFNGLAQVIVQSERQTGEITLTANSPGLSQAIQTVYVRP